MLEIGAKQGCYTIISGFEAYQEEVAKKTIERLEDEKQRFINGEIISSNNFSDVETYDRCIENAKTIKKYKVQCKCGKIKYMSPDILMRKKWRNCGDNCGIVLEKLASTNKTQFEMLKAELTNNTHESLTLIEPENNSNKIRCKCYLCGMEYEYSSSDFTIRNDRYGSRASWGYYSMARCECHSISSFQWRTVAILHEYRIPYRVEESFPDLLSDGGKPLRYDFAILNSDGSIKCLIECHGKQHYESGGGYGGYEELKLRQKRDAMKRDFAKNNDIQLIEIPYTYDTYEKEVEYLKSFGII